MTITWDSAWAPLYTGLNVAIKGLAPSPTVFATGAWEDKVGIRSVLNIEEKIQVAAEFGAEHVFVPEFWAMQNTLPEKPEIGRLRQGEKDPEKAVMGYLARLIKEPGTDASDEIIEQYYLNVSQEKMQDFYLRRCLEIVVKNANETIKNGTRIPNIGGTLISWVSDGSEMIDVGIKTFQPGKVVLLHTKTEKFEKAAQEIKADVPV